MALFLLYFLVCNSGSICNSLVIRDEFYGAQVQQISSTMLTAVEES